MTPIKYLYPVSPLPLSQWLAENAPSGTAPITTTTAVAEYLDVHPETITRWHMEGRAAFGWRIDARRRWAISVPLAEEWIAARIEEQRARPNRFTLGC